MSNYSYTVDGLILSAKDVGQVYGDNVILKGVNVEIRDIIRPGMSQGQVVALLGPSGIGKTQFFRILAGLQKPTSGTVTLGVNEIPVRPGLVGVVAQHYPLLMHRKVINNLLIAGKMAGLDKKEAWDKAMHLLGLFHLDDRAGLYPAQLSGGQKQRVSIAQQLMCSEHLILMDEPFSGLDPMMVDRATDLIEGIARLHEYNTTVVVTHDIGSALVVADTVLVMGRDYSEGKPIPGAYIKYTYNLADRGIAWRPDARKLPAFHELEAELRDLFKEL